MLQFDVGNQAEVVAGEAERWKSVRADLLLGRRVQDSPGDEAGAVEDVVQDVFLLSGVSHFPGCPLEPLQVVGGAQRQLVVGGDGGVDWLAGGSIEVSSENLERLKKMAQPSGPVLPSM